MLKIYTSKHFKAEKEYIIDTIFNEFLGVSYEIYFCKDLDFCDYVVKFDDKKLIIRDRFFEKFIGTTYLEKKNIPDGIKLVSNQFIKEQDIPVIYGDEELIVHENSIICGIDIFASSFFMLSRWEESVNKVRDKHDRFSGIESLAYKKDFLRRPVVNEYVEMMWSMLLSLGYEKERKKLNYDLKISCDVDHPFDESIKSPKSFIRALAADIFKRTDALLCLKRFLNLIFVNFKIYNFDPNNTFRWYFTVCSSFNKKAIFYFIPEYTCKIDGDYKIDNQRVKNLILEILSHGHAIGTHGSYNSYNNKKQIFREQQLLGSVLAEVSKNELVYNRQHYLRWDPELTADYLDAAQYKVDSTGGYADQCGFRYGTASEFKMWSFSKKEALAIKQQPLIVMEGSLLAKINMNLTYLNAVLMVKKLNDSVKKYGGMFTILWHNTSLTSRKEQKFFLKVLRTIDS